MLKHNISGICHRVRIAAIFFFLFFFIILINWLIFSMYILSYVLLHYLRVCVCVWPPKTKMCHKLHTN